MQKYKLFGLAPPIWVAQNLYAPDIQYIINSESKSCQSQENNPELIGFADQARKILCEEGDIFELNEWETNDVKNRIIDQCGISLLN